MMTRHVIISIHAPSRERPKAGYIAHRQKQFQSTLPRGSDPEAFQYDEDTENFNPRSLAGATVGDIGVPENVGISIHAPSRERRSLHSLIRPLLIFQSTLPRGSDHKLIFAVLSSIISIHAPSRERHNLPLCSSLLLQFQSTLPRGSDPQANIRRSVFDNFNPRSLAGATKEAVNFGQNLLISIHAPSRERLPQK